MAANIKVGTLQKSLCKSEKEVLFKDDEDLYWLGFKAANKTANREG